MERLEFRQQTQVRSDPRVKRALRIKLLHLEESARSRFDGDKPPNIENVTNALWHWFAGLSDEAADRFLAERFPKLEAAIRGDAEPEPEPQPRPQPGDQVRKLSGRSTLDPLPPAGDPATGPDSDSDSDSDSPPRRRRNRA